MHREPSIERFLLEVTLDGTIILSTPRATAVIGYRMDELKSRSIFDLVPPDLAEDFQTTLLQMMKSGTPFEHVTTKLVGKYGDLFDVEISGLLVHFHDTPIYQLTVWNVSDLVRAEAGMKRARNEAELYLDLMAHDIANLNQIGMGYLEIALDTLPLDAAGRELLQKPMEVFQSTSRLIRNIKKLRGAHLGEGWKIERVSLAGVLASLVQEYSAVPGREIVVNLHVTRDCEVMANGLLREAFANLIGNAIKHSPAERPLTIDVRLGCASQGDGFCEIAFEDNGPGIPDELKENLKTRINGRKGARSSGIGFILTGMLIEDFNGQIQIEDRVPGDYRQGARIVVLLPSAPRRSQ